MCKLSKPSDGKNHVESKKDKFVAKTYMFDIIKWDEIFYLLTVDGKISV